MITGTDRRDPWIPQQAHDAVAQSGTIVDLQLLDHTRPGQLCTVRSQYLPAGNLAYSACSCGQLARRLPVGQAATARHTGCRHT